MENEWSIQQYQGSMRKHQDKQGIHGTQRETMGKDGLLEVQRYPTKIIVCYEFTASQQLSVWFIGVCGSLSLWCVSYKDSRPPRHIAEDSKASHGSLCLYLWIPIVSHLFPWFPYVPMIPMVRRNRLTERPLDIVTDCFLFPNGKSSFPNRFPIVSETVGNQPVLLQIMP